MILELYASLVINTQKIGDIQNVNLGNYSNSHSIIIGDSLVQREQSERDELSRRVQPEARSNRDVIARERATRASGESSDIEIIGEYRVKGGCVPYAQSQGMQTSGYGYAKNYPTSQQPQAFAITYEGKLGHAVVIEKDLGDKVQVRDANYYTNLITRRIIPKSLIKGYLS